MKAGVSRTFLFEGGGIFRRPCTPSRLTPGRVTYSLACFIYIHVFLVYSGLVSTVRPVYKSTIFMGKALGFKFATYYLDIPFY